MKNRIYPKKIAAVLGVSAAMMSICLPAHAQQQDFYGFGISPVTGKFFEQPLRGSSKPIHIETVHSTSLRGCVYGAVAFMEQAPPQALLVECADSARHVVTTIKPPQYPGETPRITTRSTRLERAAPGLMP